MAQRGAARAASVSNTNAHVTYYLLLHLIQLFIECTCSRAQQKRRRAGSTVLNSARPLAPAMKTSLAERRIDQAPPPNDTSVSDQHSVV